MTYPNRTPVLGLNYGAQAAENFNWSRIDEMVANAFQPGSYLELPPIDGSIIVPGSITGAQIAPQAISSDLIYPGETVPGYGSAGITGNQIATLNTPVPVATIAALSGNPRKGPTLVTGVLPLTFSNLTASPASGALQVDLLVYGVLVPIAHFQGFQLAASSILPFTVPLVVMVQQPTGTGSTALAVQLTKTTGADATLQLKTADSGSVQMSELA